MISPQPPSSPSSSIPNLSARPALRRKLRTKRRDLSQSIQRQHAHQVAARILRLPGIARARCIALYVPTDGELDPAPIRARLARASTTWYLPVITSLAPPRLAFYPDQSAHRRRRNRFGIPEPDPSRQAPIKISSLDLVFLPLVGFDPDCQRLGMGLGFYDRCFGAIRARAHWYRRPRLIGLAHECQRVERIETNPWDVALDAVVTEQRLYLYDQPQSRS